MADDVFLDPWQHFRSIQRKADDLINSFLEELAGAGRPSIAFIPRCDVCRTGRHYVLRVALPGVLEEDIDLTVSGSTLTIRGERESPLGLPDAEVLSRELHDGYFERRFSFPFALTPGSIAAEFAEGMLLVRVEGPGH